MMVVLLIFGILMPILAAVLTWQLVIHTLPAAIDQHDRETSGD